MPLEEFGRTHRVKWMRTKRGVKQLQNRVPGIAAGVVLLGLGHELLETYVVVARLAAGQTHERAHGGVEVLYA